MLKSIFRDLKKGENIDLIVAVPLAIVLAILSILGVASDKLITSLMLLLLSLIATALLTNRYAMKEIRSNINASTNSLFLKDLPQVMEEDFVKSKEIWLVGVSLTTVIRIHYSLMERKLTQGHKFKAILVNPNGSALEMAEMRAYGKHNIERTKNEILHALDDLLELKKAAPNNIEIRTIEHPLGHGLLGYEPETSSGKIYIQNYSFQTPGGSRPKFVINAEDDFWFNFYKQEFHNLWNNSKEWQG